MFTTSDLQQIQTKGISVDSIHEQLQYFEKGFPFLKIKSAASPTRGIKIIDHQKLNTLLDIWSAYLQTNASILKFVPASGAASRMFKDLFEYIEADTVDFANNAVKQFAEGIHKFAFYNVLNEACITNEGKSIEELIKAGHTKAVISNLLSKAGLNYGALPKGLLLFHAYADEKRTPVAEHMVEGALYANSSDIVRIHFTVSTEHRTLFELHVAELKPVYEKRFRVNFEISFSEQKASTDTIAVDATNEPFRENGTLVFRPGGHGALIENLNDLMADVIFVKNIDNVVPDSLKEATITYKKAIAGLLIALQTKIFDYLHKLESPELDDEGLKEIRDFCELELNNENPHISNLTSEALKEYLFTKLNRPIRICGMVKNTGEPGGGPFLIVNQDGTVSTQILESSQIDLSNPEEKTKMMESTHFNPVDLVCGVKNYKGEKFDLLRYVDKQTGFISLKSKGGKELKALELPGLWNGSMSDWNTIFVEVPIETFNPVKIVNDLLRPEHQG